MFDIGGGELILIVLVILLFFGPKKIPEFAKMWRKGMGEIRKAQGAFRNEIENISEEMNESAATEQKDKHFKIED